MYKKIKPHEMSEIELRQLWCEEYCKSSVTTFDAIVVKFYEDMFDHAFFESASRKEKDKSILSLNRLEKMLWIKATLQDPEAVLKQGWNRDLKKYENDRRVALIKENYVVIIRFTGFKKAKFVTAYQLFVDENVHNVNTSPDWVKDPAYV